MQGIYLYFIKKKNQRHLKGSYCEQFRGGKKAFWVVTLPRDQPVRDVFIFIIFVNQKAAETWFKFSCGMCVLLIRDNLNVVLGQEQSDCQKLNIRVFCPPNDLFILTPSVSPCPQP